MKRTRVYSQTEREPSAELRELLVAYSVRRGGADDVAVHLRARGGVVSFTLRWRNDWLTSGV